MPSYGSDAEDITIADVVPVQTLRDSSLDLDDRALLDQRYARDGYLYFRGMLPIEGVAEARRRMLAPLVAHGLVEERGGEAIWVGGDRASFSEENAEFDGICRALFEWPGVKPAVDRLLGEPASLVPMVQYRAYRPHGPLGRVHQDGFFSPGIQGYRPLWIPLVEMDEEVGGLALAVGMTGRGFFHNTDKPPMTQIPRGVIPASAWARADYKPGDVLVIHPETPHTGLQNTSKRIRLSLDTRVQAAARPSILAGELVTFDTETVTLRCDDGSVKTLAIGDETYIRTGPVHGRRLSREEFAGATAAGLRVIASLGEGGKAMMLRRVSAG